MKLRLQDQSPALQAAVADPTVTFVYRPGSRLYTVPILEDGVIPRRQGFPPRIRMSSWSYSVYFCPFSGDLLPGDLYDQRIELLGELHPDTIELMYEDCRRLPKWSLSEDWWINAGIGLEHNEDYLNNLTTLPPEYTYDENIYLMRYPSCANEIPPGYHRSLEAPEHYCYALSEVIRFGTKYMYWYLPSTREYGFRIIDPDKRIDYQPIRILPVPYCPWCGTKLPESKRTEWEQRVRDTGFDPEFPEAEGFPQDLLSDTWWQNKRS